MTTARKLKVSLTLSADVLALVDRDVAQRHATRSSVIEQWLRRAANVAQGKAIEDATAAYYRSLKSHERAEDEALGHSLSVAARRVSYDDRRVGRRGRGRG
jgi:hypothetical protein